MTKLLLTTPIAALACLLVTVGTVSAHARYESSTPARGAVLDASPAQVEVQFSQEVQKVSGSYSIEVFLQPGADAGPASPNVAAGDAEVDDADRTMMRVALQPDLAPGRYVVQWTNVSDADGDPAEGAFSFYVGVQPTEADLAADTALAEAEEEPTPTAAAATDVPATAEPGATPTPGEDGDEDGVNPFTIVLIGLAAAGVSVLLGYLAYRYLTGRRP